ncbi:hypothetical protein BJ138DRAFT_1107017 [Hygrophoropsis aurantiaca]|uniref:Uncharacterized protein n=1 Tax=Hygrophoropsis aurantiaca TaxID=72124 RepID=A0ACB7ZT11_9AGAM|nr:hypothetical protein BJ138DRAFT_1107017 [Hygrophoropsis aurantiaca]
MVHKSIVDIVDRVDEQGAFIFIERNSQGYSYLHLAPTPFVLGTTVAETAEVGGGVLTVPTNFVDLVGSPFFVSVIQRIISDPTLTVVYAEDDRCAKLITDTVCQAANFIMVLRL